MNDTIKTVAIAALTLAAGFTVGRLSGRSDTVAPAADDDPRVAQREVEDGAEGQPSSRCQDAELELRFLKAGRNAKQTREQEIRRTFADGTALEEAMNWMTLVEKVIAECLPKSLELSFVECSEYPCVAALASPADATADARDELEFAASKALESCGALVEVFGEGYPIDAAVLLPFPVSCPDAEDEEAWVMLLLDPKGHAFHDLRAQPDDRIEAARINRWLYRRAHDVDRKWICAGESDSGAQPGP